MSFKFELRDEVEITVSGETGVVIGRAEYVNSDSQYWIRYKASDGRAVEGWHYEESLQR